MKTRIISAVVGILIFLVILLLSTNLVLLHPVPLILTTALAVLAAIADFEILNNTGIVKNKAVTAVSMVFTASALYLFVLKKTEYAFMLYFLFIFVLLVWSLVNHEKTGISELTAAQAYPLFIAYSFASINLLLKEYGFFAFILIFIFAWASDTFAYFTGVFFGKHKLAPVLSPKKTVEGALGGVAGSLVFTIVACLIHAHNTGLVNFLEFIPVAIVFSVVGMVGDISASYIKRCSGIKDYGNIMPGHGGVLDRFDSVLLIAPLFYAVLRLFPLIG